LRIVSDDKSKRRRSALAIQSALFVGNFMNEWLADFCLRHKEEHGKPDPFRFILGASGTVWVEYRVISVLTQCAVTTVEAKARRVPKHPMFPGFVRMEDFETAIVEASA